LPEVEVDDLGLQIRVSVLQDALAQDQHDPVAASDPAVELEEALVQTVQGRALLEDQVGAASDLAVAKALAATFAVREERVQGASQLRVQVSISAMPSLCHLRNYSKQALPEARVLGHYPSRTTDPGFVEDAIEDLAQINGERPAAVLGWRQQAPEAFSAASESTGMGSARGSC
jgi:hypothetical protein